MTAFYEIYRVWCLYRHVVFEWLNGVDHTCCYTQISGLNITKSNWFLPRVCIRSELSRWWSGEKGVRTASHEKRRCEWGGVGGGPEVGWIDVLAKDDTVFWGVGWQVDWSRCRAWGEWERLEERQLNDWSMHQTVGEWEWMGDGWPVDWSVRDGGRESTGWLHFRWSVRWESGGSKWSTGPSNLAKIVRWVREAGRMPTKELMA